MVLYILLNVDTDCKSAYDLLSYDARKYQMIRETSLYFSIILIICLPLGRQKEFETFLQWRKKKEGL